MEHQNINLPATVKLWKKISSSLGVGAPKAKMVQVDKINKNFKTMATACSNTLAPVSRATNLQAQ